MTTYIASSFAHAVIESLILGSVNTREAEVDGQASRFENVATAAEVWRQLFSLSYGGQVNIICSSSMH